MASILTYALFGGAFYLGFALTQGIHAKIKLSRLKKAMKAEEEIVING